MNRCGVILKNWKEKISNKLKNARNKNKNFLIYRHSYYNIRLWNRNQLDGRINLINQK